MSDEVAGTYYLHSGSPLLSYERPDGPYQEFYFPRSSRWISVPDAAWQQFLDEFYQGVCPEGTLLVPGIGQLFWDQCLLLDDDFDAMLSYEYDKLGYDPDLKALNERLQAHESCPDAEA